MNLLKDPQMSGSPRRTGRWFSVAVLFWSCVFGQATAVVGQDDRASQLISQLKDASPDERMRAANALGWLGDPRAVGPLIAALDDSENSGSGVDIEEERKLGDVRVAVAQALGKIKDPRALQPMIKHIDDAWVNIELIPIVASYGSSAVEPLLATLRPEHTYPENVIRALVLIGPAAVEPLVAALKDPNKHVRRSVVEALGKIHDPKAIEPLISTLKDSDSEVRILTAEALGQHVLSSTENENKLASRVDDSLPVPAVAASKNANPYLRLGAVDALRYLYKPDSLTIDAVVAALKDPDWRVRVIAAWALGYFDPNRAASASQNPSDPSLKSIAAGYKSWIRKARPGAADVLIRALNVYGNKDMAQDYWNARSASLSLDQDLLEAASRWITAHGYAVTPVYGVRY